MAESAQVHAFVPRGLKRKTFAALAMEEKKFSHWVREQMERWLNEVELVNEAMVESEKARIGTRGHQ